MGSSITRGISIHLPHRLIKLGIHLMIKRRVSWFSKHILSPYWMKLVLVLLLKWEGLHWEGPEVSLATAIFWTSIFPSSALLVASDKRSVSTNFVSSCSLNTNPPTLLLLPMQSLYIQFLPFLMLFF